METGVGGGGTTGATGGGRIEFAGGNFIGERVKFSLLLEFMSGKMLLKLKLGT